jgi:hypothetical protein
MGMFKVETNKLDSTAFFNGTPNMKMNKKQCHFIQIGIITSILRYRNIYTVE